MSSMSKVLFAVFFLLSEISFASQDSLFRVIEKSSRFVKAVSGSSEIFFSEPLFNFGRVPRNQKLNRSPCVIRADRIYQDKMDTTLWHVPSGQARIQERY